MAAPNGTKDTYTGYLHSHVLIPDEDLFRVYIRTRQCDDYHAEFSQCSSSNGRKDQMYIYGKELNCDHYMTAYEACMDWKTNKNEQQLDVLTKYERAKSRARLKNAMGNNVWPYRVAPPEDWTQPLKNAEDNDPDAIFFMDDESSESVNTKSNKTNSDNTHIADLESSSATKTDVNMNSNNNGSSGGRSCVIS